MQLNTIYEPVREDLVKVEQWLKSESRVDFLWLSMLLSHSMEGGGKQIRPALTLLCGKFYKYDIERLLPMAVATEVMHLATLVHDDAIDKSSVRHGRPTVNKLWGTERAVLLGDYMFAEAGYLTTTTKNLRATQIFTTTLKTISTGELNQSFSAFNIEQTRENYLQRISYKTASLFAMASEAGATLSDAPEEAIQLLREYGHNMGIAFQIVDDILDFIGTEEEMGKPIGSDLSQGTLTLPSMLLLERQPEDNPIRELFQGHNVRENIKRAIELVRNSNIVDECYAYATEYCDKARQQLQTLPEGRTKKSLEDLTVFVVSRKR
ncbi:MAG: polyprenyl synthetase family protein [Chloroflexi bacterium]|nr:polyprenyl synthetase family protein [Chloroflexota bacterium]